MKHIGITGATGFLGQHLAARCRRENFSVIGIGRSDFSDEKRLADTLSRCDDVVHFAGLSRHENGEYLYQVNLELGRKLVRAAQACEGKTPRLILGSTTHIDRDTPYHRSKRDLAALFAASGKKSVELLMPNTFGPGGKAFYNSVVSTFCRLCCDRATPERIDDAELRLIYVDRLMDGIVEILRDGDASGRVVIADQYRVRLPRVWETLMRLAANASPADGFERDLALTLRSYRR